MKKTMGWAAVLLVSLLPVGFMPISDALQDYSARHYKVMGSMLVHTLLYPMVFAILLIFGAVFLYRAFRQMERKKALILAAVGSVLSIGIFVFPGSLFGFLYNTYCCMTQAMVVVGWLTALFFVTAKKTE